MCYRLPVGSYLLSHTPGDEEINLMKSTEGNKRYHTNEPPGGMPRLIWDFAGLTVILLVLSSGSTVFSKTCLSEYLGSYYMYSIYVAKKVSNIWVCYIYEPVCIDNVKLLYVESPFKMK